MAQVIQIMRYLVLTYLAGWKHCTPLPTCLNLGRWRGWPFDLVQPVSTWREKDRKRRHAHTDFNFRHFSVFANSCYKKRLPTQSFVCAAGCAWCPLGRALGGQSTHATILRLWEGLRRDEIVAVYRLHAMPPLWQLLQRLRRRLVLPMPI